MQEKEVLLILTDRWADWEAAYAVAEINSVPTYAVKTIATDRAAKVSIGGIRAEIDYTIDSYHNFDNLAMTILPGGFAWQEARHDEIAAFIKKTRDFQVPVAAICGATIFLGKHGFLNEIKHTGDDLELFQKEHGYDGQGSYMSAQIVVENGFITANETAAVDFAHAIFHILEIDTNKEIDLWYDKFKYGMVR
ncbi:MAG TPA: glutamine amidotransferase [Clostridiales bacterium]|nr:glutamine amidotransferase [Clostridiales bacterium]